MRLRFQVFGVVLVLVTATIGRATFAQGKTTADKVYSKDQAARGAKQYGEVCANCHDPEKVGPNKKPAPQLVGDVFLAKWDGRQLGELLDQILQTMPNDGSVVLTEDETADLVAYILQANKFPDGAAPLKYGAASKDIVIKK